MLQHVLQQRKGVVGEMKGLASIRACGSGGEGITPSVALLAEPYQTSVWFILTQV